MADANHPMLAIAGCAVGFLISSAVGVAAAYKLHSVKNILNIIPLSGAFAAGSLTSLWIFHMLPDLSELLFKQNSFSVEIGRSLFQIPLIFFFFGFLIMLVAFVYSNDTSKINAKCIRSNDGIEHRKDELVVQISHEDDLIKQNDTDIVQADKSTTQAAPSFDVKASLDDTSSDKNGLKTPLYLKGSLKEVNWSFVMGGVAFTFHSFFEGFAAGMNPTVEGLILTTVALMLHKWVETFILVVNLEEFEKHGYIYYITIAAASLASPVGLLVESVMRETSEHVSDSLNAVSSGVLLFITFHLLHDTFFGHRGMPGKKFIAFAVASIGLAAVLIVSLLWH